MAQIGNVPEIQAVKEKLAGLKKKGLIREWEIPYEGLLTRLNAAIFFLTPTTSERLEEIWIELRTLYSCQYSQNTEGKLSRLDWKLEFNSDAA